MLARVCAIGVVSVAGWVQKDTADLSRVIIQINAILFEDVIAIFSLMNYFILSYSVADLLITQRRHTLLGLILLTFLLLIWWRIIILTFLLFSALDKHLLEIGDIWIHHAKFVHISGLDAMVFAPSKRRSRFLIIIQSS